HLVVFDCITCDKCLPVCPNAANFTYPTPLVAFDYHDAWIAPDGSWRWADQTRRFEITRPMQIACYADFCNECGNCDTFCPEYGGPYIEKPSFFATRKTWEAAAPRDGFYVTRDAEQESITGRIKNETFALTRPRRGDGPLTLDDGVVRVTLGDGGEITHVERRPASEHRLDMWAFHTLRHLLAGVLSDERVNQVNVAAG
ncbi:MAG: hypothetical protein D6744_15515, partial [Planctomycetota bacterium]